MPVPRPLALWAVPRSASTAFERMMLERGDHAVLTEPFSVAYYFGSDRPSGRFADRTLPASSYEEVLATIDRTPPPVFFKDMAHHLGDRLTAGTLRRWSNSFLIRDPAYALPSMARMWADFTDEEGGYAAQHRAFDIATDVAGSTPVVIDSRDLREHPAEVVAAWCDAMAIEPRPDALSWDPGLPEQWRLWEDWFASTAETSGFLPPPGGADPPPADPDLRRRIDAARPHYEAMHRHRLVA